MTRFLSCAGFVLVWQLLAQGRTANYLFGNPLRVFTTLLTDFTLPYHALITAEEALAGFVIGIAVGTCIGFSLWYSPAFARHSRPYVLALSSIPIFAFAPIVIVWFGIGLKMKIAVSALGTALIALTQSYEGAKLAGDSSERIVRTLKTTRVKFLRKIIIPSSINWVISSMKLSVNVALLGAFIGEFISANAGLGYYMNQAGALYDVSRVIAGGIYLMLLSALLQLLVLTIERYKRSIIRLISIDRKIRASRGFGC